MAQQDDSLDGFEAMLSASRSVNKALRTGGGWFRQESFWQSVVSQAIAGIITVVTLGILASALGYASDPEPVTTALITSTVLYVVSYGALFLTATWLISRIRRRLRLRDGVIVFLHAGALFGIFAIWGWVFYEYIFLLIYHIFVPS